ncbi:sulfotransferase family protein [Aquibium microcysteis]|uniref:sulfotransferase family protein n=1 Tax=Aquibium microcysteis TaxID=675281 RepID=UPI00165CF083|nr:sulfotransferase family protein [Aquibium microcysteis]
MPSAPIPAVRPDRKVFVVGLSKTGTSTLKEMLTALGYRVCGPRKDLLADVRAGRVQAVDPTLDAYDAFEDWPWPLVYRYANERYGPRAKFILTRRKDADTWFRSVENHGLGTSPLKSMRDAYGHYRPFGRKAAFVKTYEEHNAAVRGYFAAHPERFVEFCLEDGDGWDKLCGFLGHETPGTAVPHRNRSTPDRKPLARLINRLVIAPIYGRLPHG